MNLSLSKVSQSCLLLALFTFPFWEVFTAQFLKISSVFGPILGITKYALIIFPFFLALAFVRVRVRRVKVFYLVYLLYVSLHFIGETSFSIYFESVRYVLLYPLVLIVIFCFSEQVYDIPYHRLSLIFSVQFFLISSVAFLEFNNQDILTYLYNKSLSEIPHITWFSGMRLISVIGNPINLGAVLLFLFGFVYFDFRTNSNAVKILLIFMLAIPVVLTLSRMSTIVLVLLILYTVYKEVKFNNLLFTVVVLAMVPVLIYFITTKEIFIDTLDILFKRVGNIFDVSEYTGNLRVYHWQEAFHRFDNIFYILWGLGSGSSNPSEDMRAVYGTLIIENSFISQFVDLGVIGLVAYVFVYSRVIYLSFWFYSVTQKMGPLLGFVILLFFSFSNDYHRNLPFVFWFWFLLFYLECFRSKFKWSCK